MTQLRMLPGASSASFSAAWNSAMELLAGDFGLEDRYGLAADPYPGQFAVLELEFDLDPAGAVQRVPLYAGEACPVAAARQQPELRQVGTEQPVGVAAHRVLGDAERRAEHARLGQVVGGIALHREHEVAGGTDLRRQGGEPPQVRLQVLQRLRAAHADQQARAG